jgi:hypothetical protein
LSGRNENDPALGCFHSSPRRDDVPSRKNFGEISRTQAVGCQEIDGLRQNAPPLHFGNFESSLQRSANEVRKIIELGVAVFVAGNVG